MSTSGIDTRGPGGQSLPGRAWGLLEVAVTIAARVLTWVAVLALVALMLHVVADVGMRYFFNRPVRAVIDWVSNWWMILLGFFGFVAAAYRRDHIDVTLYSDRLSPRNERILLTVVHVLTMVFLLGVVWFGWENAMEQLAKRESTGAARIPIWPMRLVVPIGCTVFVLQLFIDMRNLWRRADSPKGGE